MSVYLSVAPPDGFSRWGDPEWERWLRDHPWEPAERLCSRAEWAIFLYQVRQHCPRAGRAIQPLLDALVNERPLDSRQALDLRGVLITASDEMRTTPATQMQRADQHFAGAEDLEAMVAAARARLGAEPTIGDVWGDLLGRIDAVLEKAIAQERGIWFGNV